MGEARAGFGLGLASFALAFLGFSSDARRRRRGERGFSLGTRGKERVEGALWGVRVGAAGWPLIIVGEAVALDARDPREPCERGASPVTGKGNSEGSTSRALALPLRDLEREAYSTPSLTDDRDVDVEGEDREARVDEEAEERSPEESDPEERSVACITGLR